MKRTAAIFESSSKQDGGKYFTHHAQLSFGNFNFINIDGGNSEVFSFRSALSMNYSFFWDIKNPFRNLWFTVDINCDRESGLDLFVAISGLSVSVTLFGVAAAAIKNKGDIE